MRLKRFELRSAHMPQRSFLLALVRGCYRTRGNLKGSLRPRYPSLKRHGELLRGPELLRARSVSNFSWPVSESLPRMRKRDGADAMEYFPIFLDLKNRPALVVGGGELALRKLRLLQKAGA